jgi:hypothetical protein
LYRCTTFPPYLSHIRYHPLRSDELVEIGLQVADTMRAVLHKSRAEMRWHFQSRRVAGATPNTAAASSVLRLGSLLGGCDGFGEK